jgi:2-oxoglutarate dehydrogenase E2 component (dihydrolipoamide succinyltransferase)
MADVTVPRLNTNDDAYVLVEWLVADGEHVAAGAPVALVETSKATDEVLAAGAGPLRILVAAGSTCWSGTVIAQVGAAGTSAVPVPDAAGSGRLITEPARALLAEHGIDEAEVADLPGAVVRRSDVEALLARRSPAPEAGPEPLSRVQQAVARTVVQSHATVPAAYTVMVVDVGAALARAAALTRAVRRPVGLVELVVTVVAGLSERFPRLFARLDDRDPAELRTWPADGAHVGVTMDLGAGLYIPVVRDAGTVDVKELATTMMRFRLAAVEGAFRDSDLSGGNVTVAVHTEHDVLSAVPLVVPGQVAALAVGAPRPELRLADGAVVERTVVHLGLAYDHRVVNGRDAAEFLAAVREGLEGQ